MPDIAIAMTIICLDVKVANNALYKNDFLMPHGPSIKKTQLAPKSIQSRIVKYTISCSEFKVVGTCKSSRLILKANSSEIPLFSMIFVFGSWIKTTNKGCK